MEIELNPLITSLPKPTDKSTLDIRYGLIPPFAYAHIHWDKEKNEMIYEIEEPILNEKEKVIFKKLEEGFKEVINIDVLVEKNTAGILDYIEKTVKILVTELNISIPANSYEKIVYYLFRNFMGMNEIEPLLRDYHIEDIECNGVGTPVFIVHRSYRTIKSNLVYKDVDELANFVEKLAQKCGRYISYASPLLDGALPDGSLDYNEPFVYKEKGIIKISKIGKFIDKFYKENISNIPVKVSYIEVPCFDKETLKVEWKKLDYVYRHKNKEDLYKLDLEFGRSVTLTGAHSLFTLTKEGIKAKKMSEVTEKDCVVIPLRIPENNVIKDINLAKELAESSYFKKISIGNVSDYIFEDKKLEIKEYLEKNYKQSYQAYYELRRKKILPVKLWNIIPEEKLKECKILTTSPVKIPAYLKVSKELMRLLGYYIAEGWTTNIRNWKKIQFCLNKKEKDLIEDIKTCFKKCFDTEIYVEPEDKNAVKLTLNSLLVWLVFNNVLKVSHYAKTKEVPEIVFNVNKELQQEFLKSWQAGDFGSTASKKLAEEISYLSLFNNKVVPFYERARIGNIEGRDIQTHEYYTNFFRRQESCFPSMIPLEMFNPLNKTSHRFQNIKISRERLKKMLNEKRYSRFKDLGNAPAKFLKEWENRGFLKGKELTGKGKELMEDIDIVNKLINSDLGFAKINRIEKVKSSSEYVYDVSVPGLENFIGGTGGVMCHNSRVNATYTKDVTSRGPTFTIRKFTKVPWTPIQLITTNAVCSEMLAYLWILVEHKSNILIAGGTGSGKTTLLNAVAFFIPPEARVVSIEDTRELNLPRENWVPSVARAAAGVKKVGEVDLFDLLKNSFRQTPEYIIVGEVRGKEAFVLFQGMASGHAAISTIHADSVDTIIKRLSTPPIELSPSLINILDAIALMTHAVVKKQETRRVTKIAEIINVPEVGPATINTPFIWNAAEDKFYFKKDSKVFEKISEKYGMPVEELWEEWDRRKRLLEEMANKKMFSFEQFQKDINDYYKNPSAVLKRYGIE